MPHTLTPQTGSATLAPVTERITGATTLGRLVLSAAQRGEDVALRYPTPDGEQTVTYAELGEHSRELALGLAALGIERGDVVSVLCATSAQWTLCELGAVCAGAVVAPIYATNSPEECRHVLADSEAKLVFCEDAGQAAKIALVRDRLPKLEHVITIDGEADGAQTLSDVLKRAAEVEPGIVEERVQAVAPEDVATLVYTSGTTGPPKGCMLTHANFLSATAMYRSQLELDDVQPIIYMFLPLAHVLARLAQVVVLDVGGTLVYWSGDPKKILDEVKAAAPTHFVAVPRIYEKLHTGVLSAAQSGGPHKRALFAWALEVGRRARTTQRAGKPLERLARARLSLADRLVLGKVRKLFGERLQMALVGAAPIDRELLEFFDACGVRVLEGYGMTESCAAATLNPPRAPRFGTVGRALPDSEVMVDEGGEILMRGPHVFAGYHKDTKATAAAFADGWLRSGDLGRLVPRRLSERDRPQEGFDHHLQRQEHHSSEHRERAARYALDLRGGRIRRPQALPRASGHARPRRGAQAGRAAGDRRRGHGDDRRRRARPGGDPGRRGQRQHPLCPNRADQALCDPRPRAHSGGGRADTHIEGQARAHL